MLKKLGELLMEKALITQSQLEAALKAQLIYGGHLGTCLIELALIDEDSLGQTLSEVSRVPYAPPIVLQEIPEFTIRTMTRKLAEEYQAIPLKLADRTLHVAMVSPRNLQAIDEISFATGYRIVPWVSPELRVFQALEKYYGVPRRLRYIAICRALDGRPRERAREKSGGPNAYLDTARSAAAETDEAARDEHLGANLDELPSAILNADDMGAEYGYGRHWREIADHLDSEMSPIHEPSRIDEPRTRPMKAPAPTSLEEVADRLCDVADRSEAVAVILDFAATRAERAILLGVQGERAALWDSRGPFFDRRGRTKAAFQVTSEPFFELVPGDGYYRGPLPGDERYAGFFSTLGIENPGELLLAPVHLNDRLVALFYMDAGTGGAIAGATEEYLRLVRMFATSLKLVLMKQKLRDIAEFNPEPLAGARPTDQPGAIAGKGTPGTGVSETPDEAA